MIVWIDLETTGLSLDCGIMEVACVITDEQYEIQEEFDLVVRPELTAWYDAVAIAMHMESGLWNEAMESRWTIHHADFLVSGMICQYVKVDEKLFLGGSSVHFDHAFIEKYMPETNKLLSHRHLDVSSLKIFWSGVTGKHTENLPPIKSETKHRALADIKDSIEAAKWYRNECLK